MNGKAFIGVNNGFSFPFAPVGYVAVLDLSNQTISDEIDLGANGLDPENLMVNGNNIYTLNNNDYSLTSISSIDAQNHTAQTTSLSLVSGCSSSMNVGSNVFYQSMYDPNNITDKNLGDFSTTLQTTIDTLFMNRVIYGMASDPVNNLIYVSETDYTSYGLVLVYDQQGNLKDAFAANVSPGTIAFDVRQGSANAISDQTAAHTELLVSPNPFADHISVVVKNTANDPMNLRVMNTLGEVVYAKDFSNPSENIYQSLDLQNIPSGIYFVQITQGEKQLVQRIVKQ